MKAFAKRMLSLLLTLGVLVSTAVFTTVDSYAFTDGTYNDNYVYLCNADSGSKTTYSPILGSYNPCADFGAKEGSGSLRVWHDGETIGGFESLVNITLNQNHPWSNYLNWYFHAWVYFSHDVPSSSENYLQFNFCHTGVNSQDGKNFNVPISGFAQGWHRIMFKLNGEGANRIYDDPNTTQFNCMRLGVHGGNILGNGALSGGFNVAYDDMYLVRSETWRYSTFLQRLSGDNVTSAEGGYVKVTGATYGGTSITSTSTAAETLTGLKHTFSDANSSGTSRSVTVPYNTSVTMQAYANTGYRFNGWGDNTTNPRTWSITSPNMNYGARFIPHVVHIVYNGNGATGGSTSTTQNVAYNNTSAEKATFRSNGFSRSYTVTYNGNGGTPSTGSNTASYSFSKWAVGSTSGTQYSAGAVIPDKLSATNNANINVYAIWTGGTCTSATATRSGYTFNGWYTAASGGSKVVNGGTSFTPGSTRTLYAQWTENTPSFGNRSVSCTYSGSNQDITFTAASGGFGSYKYSKQSGASQLSIPTNTSNKIRVAGGTSAGTYSAVIRATNNGGSKYADGTVTVTVGRAAGSVTCNTDKMTLTYGGSGTKTSVSGTGTLSVSSSNTGVATVSISGSTITVTSKGVGTATITVSAAQATNYNAASKTFTVQVNKANFSDPTFANTTRTYNGSAQSPTVSNAQSATITYSTSSGGTYSSTMPSMTNAGSMTIYWKATRGGNYNDRSGSFTFTISKASGSVTCNTDKMTLTYGNSGTKTSVSGTGTLSVSSSNTGVATVSISGSTITVTSKGIGSATITVSAAAATNYNAASKTFTVQVNKANFSDPTFANTTRTYNGSAQSPTVSNAQSATITYSTSSGGTYSSTMPSMTNAGSMTIYWKATRGGNYNDRSGSFTFTINKAGGTMTINSTAQMSLTYPSTGTRTVSKNTSTVSVSSSNTAVATVSISGSTITVTAGTTAGSATITVTSAATGNYNAASTTFTVAVSKGTLANPSVSSNTHTYDGASHGATVTAGTSSTIKFGTASGTYNLTSVPTYKNAGTYTIYWQQTKAGYNDKTGSFQITINQREVTLTWGTASFTYNGSSHVPTCTLGNIVSGDTVTVTVTGAQTNAGSYTATASELSNANYKLPSSKTKAFTINQKEVTLTWGTASFTYNGSSHVPTCTLGNVVSGDTVKVTVTGAQTNAGTYTATASELSNANYKLPASNTKSFTINKASQAAPVGISAMAETFKGKADGMITGVTTEMEYKLSSASSYTACGSGNITGLAAGSYMVRVKAKTNYNASATVTIVVGEGSQITLTVIPSDEKMGTVTGSAMCNYNTKHTITATAKNGYRFEKWNDGNTSASRTVTVVDNVQYIAIFKSDSFTIKFEFDGGYIGSQTSIQNDIGFGDLIVVPTPVKKGYELVGWTPSVPNTMPEQDLTFTAVWTKITPAITVSEGVAANGMVAKVDISINENTAVTSLSFNIIYDSMKFTTPPTVTFEKYDGVVITANTEKDGIVAISVTCAEGLAVGGKLATMHFTIPEDLAFGVYALRISSINCNVLDGITQCRINSVGSISVTTAQYGVTLYYNGGSVISGNITKYSYGVGAKLPQVEANGLSKLGYTFVGWYDNASFTGNMVTKITKTDSGDKKYYAKWINTAYSIIPSDQSVETQAARNESAALIESILANTTLTDQQKEAAIEEEIERAHLEIGVLNVAIQTMSGTTPSSDNMFLRLVTTLDDNEKYSNIRFKVTLTAPDKTTHTQYITYSNCFTTLRVVSGEDVFNLNPDVFDSYSKYFVVGFVPGIPNDYFADYKITVQTIATLADGGQEICGVEKTKSLSELITESDDDYADC